MGLLNLQLIDFQERQNSKKLSFGLLFNLSLIRGSNLLMRDMYHNGLIGPERALAMFDNFKPIRNVLSASVMLLATGVILFATTAQGKDALTTLSLMANNLEYRVSVQVPTNWSVAPQMFKNQRSLIDAASGTSDSPSTEIQIYVEPRLDHQDALKQIREATALVSGQAKVVTAIGGWPAVQIQYKDMLSQPGQGSPSSDPEVLRITTYIAVDATLYIVTGTLPVDASPELRQTVVGITSSLNFRSASDAEQLQQDLQFLLASVRQEQGTALATSASFFPSSSIIGFTAVAEKLHRNLTAV